jgi:hypothetical protein
LGYSSYDELKRIMSQRPEPDNASAYDMLVASSKGFLLALAVAEDYGFRLPEPADTLASRLAREVLRNLR